MDAIMPVFVDILVWIFLCRDIIFVLAADFMCETGGCVRGAKIFTGVRYIKPRAF